VDLIDTGRDNFLLYRHEPGQGWEDPRAVQRIPDLDQFPDLSLSRRYTRLADMCGDGLQDFVLLQSGNVSYWPYLGNGVWSERVIMSNPPRFPEGYREERVLLADLDGDGCVDVVYIDYDSITIWLNQCGTGFAPPITIPVSPAGARVIAGDLYGDGRVGFIWSARPAREYGSGYRCLRFAGAKPYLMTSLDNGMGGRFEMTYSTSTAMRLADATAGNIWNGELPIVVHVVNQIREQDLVTGRSTDLSMRYHDGVYDGMEREFRGFAAVSVEINGDDSIAASRQKYTFFQGETEIFDPLERERQRALAGALLTTETYERVEDQYVLRNRSSQTWETRLEFDGPGGSTFFPFINQIETREYGSTASPERIEYTRLLDYDAHGNPRRRVRESLAEGSPPSDWIRSEERFTFTENESAWLVKLPVRLEYRDGTGVPVAVKIHYYDGPAFVGLAEGEAEHGLISRVRELALLESLLPADYVGDRDMSALGYELLGTDDTRGYYATTSAFQRDLRGNVVVQRDPLNNPLNIAYDADGVYPETTTDALTRETQLIFNPIAGEPSRIELPDERVIRYVHDAVGRLIAQYELDDDGAEQLVKCWVLDLANTPTSITSIAPDSGGRLHTEFGPESDFTSLVGVSLSRIYFDGFSNRILEIATAPDGLEGIRRFATAEHHRLNPRGLVAETAPPQFVANLDWLSPPMDVVGGVRYRYDVFGNATETAGPGPVHHRVVRDVSTITHYEGAGAGPIGSAEPPGPAVRIEHFDARARLVSLQESKDSATSLQTSYDLTIDGRIEVIRDDARQEVANYTHAGPGEAIRIHHRDAGTRTYYRDAAGQIAERINADGSSLHYRYDALGRVTHIEYHTAGASSGGVIREIIYDEDPNVSSTGRFLDGRIALIRETGNEFRYSYNRVGKIVNTESTVAGLSLSTGHEHNLQGRPIGVVYPDGHRVTYTLGSSGEPAEIPGVVADLDYDPDGRANGYRLANGVDVTMARDPFSRRLTEISARHGDAILRRLAYGHDSIGNIERWTDEMPGSVEHHSFSYDGLYRLDGYEVRANAPTGPIMRSGTYEYDATGNLQQIEEIQSLTLRYTDAARPGRVTEVSTPGVTQTIQYEDRGNIQSFADLASIEYDALDRISRIVKTDGTEIRLAYDPQGRRVLKEVVESNGTTRRIHYAAGLYERHETHAIRHIHLGKKLIASERISLGDESTVAPLYYLSDHLGTVLLATDDAGAIVHNQRYSPFGSALNTSDELDRYLGRERDVETGLVQFGARYYASAIGRFISPDWYVLENPSKPVRMPQGYNLYSYGLNNPLVFRDPSGMWFLIDDLIVAVVGFVVGFVSGLIYGLVNGQGWDSLLTALETGLTTAAGAWLGWNVAGPLGAFMGGMNGLVSGIHGIYDWTSIDGWFAFISDSTWGLLGTSLGNIVHIVNLFWPDSNYREDLSRRQNRHIYEGGVAIYSDFAFTMGNVISNAGQGGAGIDSDFLSEHEELHIWQNRFFGPLFQATYIVWGVGGFLVATVYWFFNSDEDWGSLVETAAYYDNPFEVWAYDNNNFWPPTGANPALTW
jgi:RHS repeat-associated protein